MNVLVVLAAYLIGAIPFSYLVGKCFAEVDVRARGSGNVGATNVLRTAGVKCGLLAAALDIAKGIFPAWLGMVQGGVPLACVCGVVAVIGHCWPVFLKFKGGKGVATSGGVLIYLVPKAAVFLIILFLVTVAVSRIVSLGSLAAAVINPIMVAVIYQSWVLVLAGFVLTLIVVYKHRENIERLRRGQEPRLGRGSLGG
ncbi:glycerol-3-phosphate 1-O-acyltransferase PlsY [Syntrophothermus lipocalidus]|uniref:Glycerol-3-phosphate acyltransferase n=1 Tax=Syntrophothermus lipocalidus (strain DSM 12680 / TGB-C1) TaxID=643648 RepID=D7CNF0_SYNLT|nr:glycerol-3-phosphate 1-O-acyltransferase PlsY [Syntrophothermus lipocalidus]ADI02235.1 protein of unknown function DUF205 [Syntrophothermus lipocalidus DSM 12680]HOV43278.1 glycerol-3-phosphate 1-O-acyltransferase PlsY [Syntrophothermus lipocalidus]